MKCIDCLNAERCLDHKEQPSLIGCTSGIPRRKKPTWADRIRSMSDEELAEWLTKITDDAQLDAATKRDYQWKDWLQSEVEE